MGVPPPPGSLGAPFIGETLPFLSDPFGFVLTRTRELGDVWKTRFLGDTVVCFAGPEAFSSFVDPEPRYSQGQWRAPNLRARPRPSGV